MSNGRIKLRNNNIGLIKLTLYSYKISFSVFSCNGNIVPIVAALFIKTTFFTLSKMGNSIFLTCV